MYRCTFPQLLGKMFPGPSLSGEASGCERWGVRGVGRSRPKSPAISPPFTALVEDMSQAHVSNMYIYICICVHDRLHLSIYANDAHAYLSSICTYVLAQVVYFARSHVHSKSQAHFGGAWGEVDNRICAASNTDSHWPWP